MIPTELNSKNYDEYIAEAKATCQSYHASSMNCLRYGIHSWAPRCWFYNLRQLWRNIRMAHQRIVHGYCDWDLWQMDSHLLVLMSDMLDDLAIHSMGYPGVEPYDTPEAWQTALLTVAKKLRAADDEDNQFIINPLYDEYMEHLLDTDISDINSRSELVDNYLANDKTCFEKRIAIRNEALDWIKENFNRLWD